MKLGAPRIAAIDTRRVRPPAKRAEPFYLTREWRALMGRLLYERGRRCEKCGAQGCRIFGDHIVELKDGGAALAERNVMLLCGACHSAKTARARAVRMGARGVGV